MAMVVGNFSGAEAGELRKAVGMRRSWKRMEELMVKLRVGMSQNKIPPATQDEIVQSIPSGKFLKVYGKLQNQDGVVHVKAERLEHLNVPAIALQSYDFH